MRIIRARIYAGKDGSNYHSPLKFGLLEFYGYRTKSDAHGTPGFTRNGTQTLCKKLQKCSWNTPRSLLLTYTSKFLLFSFFVHATRNNSSAARLLLLSCCARNTVTRNNHFDRPVRLEETPRIGCMYLCCICNIFCNIGLALRHCCAAAQQAGESPQLAELNS